MKLFDKQRKRVMKKLVNKRRKSHDFKAQINPLKFLNSPKYSVRMKKIKSFESQLTKDGEFV